MTRQQIGLWLGPLLALAVALWSLSTGLGNEAIATAALTTLCAVWWMTEPIPIPATSMLPFALLPMLGVLDNKTVAQAYGHPMILLLLGGFMLSRVVERSGAHRRLALWMVRAFGRFGTKGVLLGFMMATALGSMWISNSATVLMMLPVAAAVISQSDDDRLPIALLLGIAYAGSVGGIATPIGTPPNVICLGVMNEKIGEAYSFAEWMAFGIPFTFVFLPIAWLWLGRGLGTGEVGQLPDPGPMRIREKRVLALFLTTAVAWITREAPFLAGGWSHWFGLTEIVNGKAKAIVGDETVALVAVGLAFLIPEGRDARDSASADHEPGRLLDWKTAEAIPWGLLLLFAGGIALAAASQESGLSKAVGSQLGLLADLHPVVLVLSIALFITFLTEVSSNTASAILLLPILADAALENGLDPKRLMIPAAISASCAFMLPVATAPNAIVFGTGKVPIVQMAKNGFALNLIGATLATAITLLLI
ncbi:MAG: SLC13 family permease [Planctomycetota bacterium]